MFDKLRMKAKAFAPAVVACISLIIVGIVIYVSLIITGALTTVANGYNFGTAGNATRAAVQANTYASLNLLTILLIPHA